MERGINNRTVQVTLTAITRPSRSQAKPNPSRRVGSRRAGGETGSGCDVMPASLVGESRGDEVCIPIMGTYFGPLPLFSCSGRKHKKPLLMEEGLGWCNPGITALRRP